MLSNPEFLGAHYHVLAMSKTSILPICSSGSSQPSSSPKSEDSTSDSAYSSETQPTTDPTSCPDSKTTDFFFIDFKANKKSSTQYREKQAFVLKRYNREKRHAAIQRLRPSKPSSSQKSRLPLGHSGSSPVQHGGASEDPDKSTNDTEPVTTTRTVALNTYLCQSFKDPFDCYAVPMTDSMHMYLNYFRIHGVGAGYPLSRILVGEFLFQKAIYSPAILYIFCFFSARYTAFFEAKAHGILPFVKNSINNSLHFRGNALKHLNHLMQDLTNAVAEPTIVAIASFVAVESTLGNIEAVEAHLKGLKRLVYLFGGIDALHHMTLLKLYQCDNKSAVLKNKRPTFAMSARFCSEIRQWHESDMVHINPTLTAPPGLADLGDRFMNSTWFTALDTRMQASIKAFRRLVLYFENTSLHPKPKQRITDNSILVVVGHRLLSLSFPVEGEEDLNEPLRLCLLLYLNIRIWPLRGLPIINSLVASLRENIDLRLPYLHSVAPDLVFWMLFMGGMASTGGKLHAWFIAQLRETRDFLQVQDWIEARTILTRFFYTDQRGETAAEDFWNEALLTTSYPNTAPNPVHCML
ncbi:hypothetical protein BJX63DRAFT_392360 [Aspergillus granulosus]|uniref:Uncharacterized protein n=1 Tax=Aspergillus granulosus TaxID=176169 RepID=A0ABR4HI97_9EURO